MATSRPAALSTNFFLAIRSCRPQTYRSIRSPPVASVRQAKLHTTSKRRQQDTGYQRYGPAATPSIPPPAKPSEPYLPSTEQTEKDASEQELKKAARRKLEAEESAKSQDPEESEEQAGEEEDEGLQEKSMPEPDEVRGTQPELQTAEKETKSDGAEEKDASQSEQPEIKVDDEPLANKELDIVLSVPTPQEVKAEASSSSHHHPHLEASPYEHHFDTYTLVQDLCKSDQPGDQTAFTSEQAITLMKAIRMMLAQNLDLAKDGLVSKSDTENETYLFRAACSELKTTMETSRFMEAQKQRSQRAQLQHEFDILNQKVSQDIMTMREELKAMFNDRKLGLQEEKRQTDGKIQSLSYRISVDLNSEAKSEVEGLRWVLTRRAAMAIGAAALMTLTFLQYYSTKARQQAEIDKKKQAAQQQQEDRMKREQERFGGSGNSMRSSGTQTDGIVLGGTAGTSYEESLG